MPRYNVFIPDHQVEQWEAIEKKSRWVQEKLDEEWKKEREQRKIEEKQDVEV